MYRDLQQKLIDVLDQGVMVHIKGRDGNRTELTVALHEMTDPSKQTLFENCVADVNIPVGRGLYLAEACGNKRHSSCEAGLSWRAKLH